MRGRVGGFPQHSGLGMTGIRYAALKRSSAAGLVAGALGCLTPQSRPLTDAAAKVVRDTVMTLENGMNLAVDALDCHSGLAAVGDGQPLFVSEGNVVRTRADLAHMCESMVAPRTGAVFVVDTLTAHALSADAAYLVREGRYTISFKDGRSTRQYLIMTTVWHRGSDGWKMIHLHESWRPLP